MPPIAPLLTTRLATFQHAQFIRLIPLTCLFIFSLLLCLLVPFHTDIFSWSQCLSAAASAIAMVLANHHLAKTVPFNASQSASEWPRIKSLIVVWTFVMSLTIALYRYLDIVVLALFINVLPVVAIYLDYRLTLLVIPLLPFPAETQSLYISRLSKFTFVFILTMSLIISYTLFSYTFLSDHVDDSGYLFVILITPFLPLTVLTTKSSVSVRLASNSLTAPELTIDQRNGLERLMWMTKGDAICVSMFFLNFSAHSFEGPWGSDADLLMAFWAYMLVGLVFHFALGIYVAQSAFDNYLSSPPPLPDAQEDALPSAAAAEETRLLNDRP